MPPVERQVLRFAGFELEPDERRLSRRGRIVPLTPKAFELLALMVQSAGRVLSKDDLMSALWPGRFVMESNLTKHVWLLRKALDDSADGERCIETVSKIGYRFVAPVIQAASRETPADARPSTPSGGPSVWAKFRAAAPGRRLAWAFATALIAVVAAMGLRAILAPDAASADRVAPAVSLLEFDNLSRNPRDAWVGPALAETLGTEIGLGGRLRVIPGELARPAQAGLPPPGAGGYARKSLETLRRRLGADYVLSGSYLVSGDGPAATVRLDIALQRVRGGAVVSLSRRGPVADLPTLVTAIGADLRKDLGLETDRTGDIELAANVQPPTAEVMRHMGQGLDALHRYDATRARDEFLEAVAQAPGYAPAYVYLAQAWSALGYQAKARAAAQQAAAHAADLPAPMRLRIEAQGQTARFDWPGAVQTLRRLIALAPSDPEARLQLIDALLSAGKPSDAAAALAALRAVPGRGENDPRLELAAASVAAARDDDKARGEHAARALAQARANDQAGLAADAEVQLGAALTARDPKAAGESLRRALIDYRRVGNPHGEAWAEQSLGNLLADSDPPGARAAYERALAQYQAIGDLAGTAKIYSDLAIMLWSSGDRDAAETAANHALEIRRQTSDKAGEAWALAALAVAWSDENADDAVVAQFRQAIALDIAAGAQAHLGFSLYSLADVLRLRGELTQAQAICARAQSAYAALDDPASRHLADLECAQIALDRGDVTAAEAGSKSARQAARQIGDAMTLGNADQLAGQIAAGEGRSAEAAGHLDMARREFAGAEMITGEAVADSLLALSETALNRPAPRDAAAQRAAELRGRITERQEVFQADIATAQLRGEMGERNEAAAALEALAADAQKRRWVSWALEARLAELVVLSRAGETARSRALRQSLSADARRSGFLWVLRRRPDAGRDERA